MIPCRKVLCISGIIFVFLVFNVYAQVAPALTGIPQSIDGVSGQNVTFTISSTGTAPFAYQWYKNGIKISGATSSVLSLRSIGSTDAGQYSVRVSNNYGSTWSGLSYKQVSAGFGFSVYITSDHKLWGMGENVFYQLTNSNSVSYTHLTLPTKRIV